MHKKKINLRETITKFQANCDRIGELADACEKENRERTEVETKEYEALTRENQMLQMRLSAAAADSLMEANGADAVAEADRYVRESLASGKRVEFKIQRDLIKVSNAEAGNLVSLKIGDIVKPIEEGLILSKVGIPLKTGLAGDYVWPVYESVTATVMDEGISLTDSAISLSKLTATPQRIGVAIPVTREALNQTEGLLESIVKEVLPQAVVILLNKIMFSTTAVTGASTLKGPFVGIKATNVFELDGTFKKFNEMKAKVLATGIDGAHLCWVMTQADKALAEATPKDAGSGIMVCENDKIAGIPVFCTQYIGDTNVGLGDWRYQPLGMFGDMSFIVDPFSQARKNAVDFVLNVNYGTVTLRPDAFKLGKITYPVVTDDTDGNK